MEEFSFFFFSFLFRAGCGKSWEAEAGGTLEF